MRAERGRSGVAVVLTVLLVAALLAGADRVAAWAVARSVAHGVTTAAAAEGHTVLGAQVEFHGFPFLTQLAAGRLERVTGSIDTASIGGQQVDDVHLAARGLAPRDPWHAEEAEVDGLVTFDTVARVLGDQLGTPVTLERDGDHLEAVRLTTSVLGLDVGAVVVPQVKDAATVAVQVSQVQVGGATLSADDLPGGLGDRVGALSFPLDLPDGVELRSVRTERDGLRVSLSARNVDLARLAS